MGEKQRTLGHHAAATYHHGQAAYYHREASKHYEAGKDYAHAAHMALTAHGHALKALWHGNEAHRQDERLGTFSSEPFRSTFDVAAETERKMESTLSSAAHHAAAAADHEQAVKHLAQLAEFQSGNDHVEAAQEADIAHGYARHAIFHGDEAAMHYVEHYGKSGPTAELL